LKVSLLPAQRELICVRMNDIRDIDWAKLKIQPLDERLPTPEQMRKSWMRAHAHGLWIWDLHAGYDWSLDTAVEMLKGGTIAEPANPTR